MDPKKLREEFAQIHKECGELLTAAHNEKRSLTAEEKTAQEARYARLDTIKEQLESQTRMAKYSSLAATAVLAAAAAIGGSVEVPESQAASTQQFDADAYRDALNHYARTGVISRDMFSAAGLSEREVFAITQATQSGIMIPKSVVQPTEIRRNVNPWRRVIADAGLVPLTRTAVEGVNLPVFDDTGNDGAQQAEGATSGTAADAAATGSIILAPILYGSKQMWFSNTTVMAPDFDVFAYVQPALDKRLNRIQNSDWTAEVIAGSTIGKTAAGAAAITYAEVLDWEHSLPVPYRADAVFVLSDSFYRLVRGLVDSQGRPLIEAAPGRDWTETMHGKPLYVDDYFAAVATSAKVGCFVSAEAIKILDAGPRRVARYAMDSAHPDQTGFEMFQNGDFGFITNGCRVFRMG